MVAFKVKTNPSQKNGSIKSKYGQPQTTKILLLPLQLLFRAKINPGKKKKKEKKTRSLQSGINGFAK